MIKMSLGESPVIYFCFDHVFSVCVRRLLYFWYHDTKNKATGFAHSLGPNEHIHHMFMPMNISNTINICKMMLHE